MGVLHFKKGELGSLTTPRLFVQHLPKDRKHLHLDKEYRHYLKSVLRLREGEKLSLFDGSGWDFEARLLHFTDEAAFIEILAAYPRPEPIIRITLAQALPKSDKMDFIIQKATELGITKMIPFKSARSVPRIASDKASVKQVRWQRIARAAAEQSGRVDIPDITEPLPFDDMLTYAGKADVKLIFWEGESRRGIRKTLRKGIPGQAKDIFIIVGPEGGLTWDEVERASAEGFVPVSLGRHILRVETAVVAILSILQYELGTLGTIEDTTPLSS